MKKFFFADQPPTFLRDDRRIEKTFYFEDFIYDDCEDDIRKFHDTYQLGSCETERKVSVISGSYGSDLNTVLENVRIRLNRELCEIQSLKIGILKVYYMGIEDIDFSKIEDMEERKNKINRKFEILKTELDVLFLDEIQTVYSGLGEGVEKVKGKFNDFLKSLLRGSNVEDRSDEVDIVAIGSEPRFTPELLDSPFHATQFHVPYFTLERSKKMVVEYNKGVEEEKRIPDDFVEYLYDVTNGHKGYFCQILVSSTQENRERDSKDARNQRMGFGFGGSIFEEIMMRDDLLLSHASDSRMYKNIVDFVKRRNPQEFGNNSEDKIRLSGKEIVRNYPLIYSGTPDIDDLSDHENSAHELGLRIGLIRIRNGNHFSEPACLLVKLILFRTTFRDSNTSSPLKFFDGQNMEELVAKVLEKLDRKTINNKSTFLSRKNCAKEIIFHAEFYRILSGDSDYSVLMEANVKRLFFDGGDKDGFNKLKKSVLGGGNYGDDEGKIARSLSQKRIDLVLQKVDPDDGTVVENHVIELVSSATMNRSEHDDNSVEEHWNRNVEIYKKIPKLGSHCVIAFYGKNLIQKNVFFPEQYDKSDKNFLMYAFSKKVEWEEIFFVTENNQLEEEETRIQKITTWVRGEIMKDEVETKVFQVFSFIKGVYIPFRLKQNSKVQGSDLLKEVFVKCGGSLSPKKKAKMKDEDEKEEEKAWEKYFIVNESLSQGFTSADDLLDLENGSRLFFLTDDERKEEKEARKRKEEKEARKRKEEKEARKRKEEKEARKRDLKKCGCVRLYFVDSEESSEEIYFDVKIEGSEYEKLSIQNFIPKLKDEKDFKKKKGELDGKHEMNIYEYRPGILVNYVGDKKIKFSPCMDLVGDIVFFLTEDEKKSINEGAIKFRAGSGMSLLEKWCEDEEGNSGTSSIVSTKQGSVKIDQQHVVLESLNGENFSVPIALLLSKSTFFNKAMWFAGPELESVIKNGTMKVLMPTNVLDQYLSLVFSENLTTMDIGIVLEVMIQCVMYEEREDLIFQCLSRFSFILDEQDEDGVMLKLLEVGHRINDIEKKWWPFLNQIVSRRGLGEFVEKSFDVNAICGKFEVRDDWMKCKKRKLLRSEEERFKVSKRVKLY